MKNRFIVLEGLDGVGKTTCGKLLANKLGAVYIATPMAPFRALCGEIDSLEDYSARFHFFLSSILSASTIINKHLESRSVVCDRYVYSTFAYHRAMGADTANIEIKDLPLVLPDHTFYLTLEESLRLERLKERGPTKWDKRFSDPVWKEKLQKEFELFPMTQVEVNAHSPSEVTNLIFEILRREY